MKNLLPFLFLFFICPQIFSQNLKGKVIDVKGNPLELVNVFILKDGKGTTTDSLGIFEIRDQSKLLQTDTIRFSYIGYITLEITFQKLLANKNVISLSENIEELQEVALKGKNRLKDKLDYSKLTRLKNNVFAFGSYIVNNKIYIIGGDASTFTDVGKKVILHSNGMIESIENYFVLMRRYNEISKFGYSNELQIYDLNENIWVKNEVTFDNRAYHNVAYYNNNLYAFGGERVSKNGIYVYLNEKIEILNLDSLNVTVDYTNPHQAKNVTSVVFKDYLVTMGGSFKENKNGKIIYSDKVHFYNFKSGLWYELPSMINPKETNSVLIKDKIYVVGGFDGKPLSTIDVLDLNSEVWQEEIDLPSSMSQPALTVHNEKIYIYDAGLMYVYNPPKKTFVTYEINLHVEHARMHYFNGAFYLIGGFTENEYSKKPSPNIYIIHENEFLKTKSQTLVN
ncbi:Kelch repeat-containing protein [Bizionia arctica]|uniref:Galactose oxidase n=1 Tax=Bizionia arctica TaxID=1495645 RepID=A0A917GU59_9FLAO|nr:carboxypeptidase-like regulatory domain-containing protein [Bizionia arctica]GGG57301.1 hypothetical protein GCM10010976_30180 [Bizionia arctica]